MKENKNIPYKNYIILSIILIVSIFVVIYFYKWYDELKRNNINTPVMNEYLSTINYNEIDTYLVENQDVIIYASSLDDKNTRRFEKKLKKIVKKYTFNNTILYLDLTDNNKSINNIIQKYHITSTPCIIIFESGEIKDIYNIKDYNYDVELLVSYLRIKGVIYD